MLIGLGLGPGSPDLLTLRAIKLIQEADAVFVPGRIAKEIVSPYRDAILLSFPMTDDESEIQSRIEEHLDVIAPVAAEGMAVFGILGDPNFFSTFSRLTSLMESRYPHIPYRAEPGISAITAFASAAGISISSGFEVSDGSELSQKILLKVRRPHERAEALREEGYNDFVLVERMFFPDMRITRGKLPETCDYLSLMYASKEKI